ncbi:S26 family signal peptidase [Idiomarina abyssalis]|mgnify:CR=1 FL=1|uniref:S26 family signal peptidase n=1 Tax=Idiomarina abyssalis TaxID=86102 RepID=A0A8I1GE69_9GAMM|nr:S26 family signal peptidase [Idiomarina abyssalis]MBJ7265530.1 S26 family signal peptidase [Idiomarina abyssalis]MBJ7316796.1 S26 family signal peptidase [Idiomarina abyssalis]
MSWAKKHIDALKDGKEVSFRPKGRSMEPVIKSGQRVNVCPVEHGNIEVGDIVLCKVAGNIYLHFVARVVDNKFTIKNNRGKVNGITTADKIYGKVTKIHPESVPITQHKRPSWLKKKRATS